MIIFLSPACHCYVCDDWNQVKESSKIERLRLMLGMCSVGWAREWNVACGRQGSKAEGIERNGFESMPRIPATSANLMWELWQGIGRSEQRYTVDVFRERQVDVTWIVVLMEQWRGSCS